MLENDVLLYSLGQKCYHHETLGDYIAHNIERAKKGEVSDYQLIAIFNTEKEYFETCMAIEEKLNLPRE